MSVQEAERLVVHLGQRGQRVLQAHQRLCLGGALLQWALALKDAGRPVRLLGVHRLLAVFFHVVGIVDVAEVQPAAD